MTRHPEHQERFDIHQRIQHVLMMGSFMICLLTGWPLRTARTEPSPMLAEFFGGVLGCRIWHRLAAAVMIGACVYHLLYLGWLAAKGRWSWEMLPRLDDAKHIFQNIAYLAGFRKEPPDFGRWAYFEKFEYLAVFYSMAVMGGSGLVLWFPVTAALFLPGWALEVAVLMHGFEATLAFLAVLISHLYVVHLRPAVWPMSWVWIDGKISLEELKEAHPAEYRRLYPEPEKRD